MHLPSQEGHVILKYTDVKQAFTLSSNINSATKNKTTEITQNEKRRKKN